MKKLLLFLTVFAFALTANVFAQVSDDVGVTADVQAALNIETTDVVFGTIEQATSILAANENDTPSENIGTTATPGSLTIEGTSGSTVQITFDEDATLALDGDENETITFTPSFFFGNSSVANEDTIELDGALSTVNIGGSLSLPGATGSYSTEFDGGSVMTVTVQYVSL